MNYIREIEAFEDWLEVNNLPQTAQLLWYKLLVLCNRAGWSEWIVASDQLLMAKLKITSKNTLIKARKTLIEAGLIKFKIGTKGKPSMYKLNSVAALMTQLYKNGSKNEPYSEFGSKNEPYIESEKEFGSKNEPYSEPYREPYREPNKPANPDVSSTPEVTKHKHKHINNIDNEKEYNKRIINAFLKYQNIAKEENVIEAREFIKCLALDYGLEKVEKAVQVLTERSKQKKITNPHNYLVTLVEGEDNDRRNGNSCVVIG